MTLKKILTIICLYLFSLTTANAQSIKVLILDDVFQRVPPKEEILAKMGSLKGDLLVNGTHYPGNIEVLKGKDSLYLINELPLEEYVKSVVNAEVGKNWDMEALKVQAVISRTYALYHKKKNGMNENYDLTSSVLHQVYKGASADARISYAVMNTEGEVLTFNGALIEAFYHSTSVGMTEDPEEVFGKSVPYLRPVKSNCEISPYWVWERRIPAEEIEKTLNVKEIKDIRIKSHTRTQRVKTVDVYHSEGVLNVKTTNLRKMLGWNRLPSTNFTLSSNEDNYIFDGKGYGHGVGLCQWSALEMAREGMSYRQILEYFYPGTKLEKL